MNAEVRQEFTEEVQKGMTQECSLRCFSGNESCLEECYNAYIKSLNCTAKALRKEGYLRNSRYINLAYGEEVNEWERITLFNDKEPDIFGYPHYYFERNIYDAGKDK